MDYLHILALIYRINTLHSSAVTDYPVAITSLDNTNMYGGNE